MNKRLGLSTLIFIIFFTVLSFLRPDTVSQARGLPTPTAQILLEQDSILEIKDKLRFGGQLPIGDLSLRPVSIDPNSTTAGEGIYDWSKISFQSFIENNYEVVAAMGDGSSPQRLTHHPANDGRARLNRGATKVVFSSNRDGDYEIYSININGSNLKQLTSNSISDAIPMWSPDGERIAYSSNQSGIYEIYIMNADGSGKTKLTNSGGLNCFDPSWSPDGSDIIYATWDENGVGNIWSIPVSGGSPTQLTSLLLFPGHPMWSPDGSKIAFDYANPNNYLNEYMAFGNPDAPYYWSVQIDDLATYEEFYLGGWSPDSQQVIFNRIQYELINGRLYITGAYLETACAQSGVSCTRSNIQLQGTGLDFLPHWQTADIDHPSTTMVHLPPYSRADGFLLQWDGYDEGLAPITRYFLEAKGHGIVEDWIQLPLDDPLSQKHWFAAGESGDMVSFRARAWDDAGNLEPWLLSPDGSTQTTLYTYELSGKFADNRGVPIAESTLITIPTPVQIIKRNGDYRVLLKNKGITQINAQASGYGPIFNTERELHADLLQNFYFPPENNLVLNGNWEQGNLADWSLVTSTITSTTALTVAVQSDHRHSGQWAVTLGSQCAEPCWAVPETITSTNPNNTANQVNIPQEELAIMRLGHDDVGSIHVLVWQFEGLNAYERSPLGVWSGPTLLDSEHASSPQQTYLLVEPNGDAFAVWTSPDGTGTKIAHKSASLWTILDDLPDSVRNLNLMDATIDSNGGLYIIYQQEFLEGTNLFYCYRTSAGVWQSPVKFTNYSIHAPRISSAALTISQDQNLHIFWDDGSFYSDIFYLQLKPDGTPVEQTRIKIHEHITYYYLIARSDKQNQIHLFYDGDKPTHITKYPNGTWSGKEYLPTSTGSITFDDNGTIYVINDYEDEMYKKPSGKEWSQLSLIDGDAFTVDNQGKFHLASRGINYLLVYQPQERSSETDEISIHQQTTIPEDSNKPTLSFNSQLRGGPESTNSYFEILINDGFISTQVYSATTTHLWEHDWVSLDDWLGKEITVTFKLHQGTGDHMMFLDLDDISIGAWETPIIHAVTPNPIHSPETNQSITIIGENFIQKPSVFIDDFQIAIEDVAWIDENSLTITLPASIVPGLHDLKVINPGGQISIKRSALQIGWLIYLPKISHFP